MENRPRVLMLITELTLGGAAKMVRELSSGLLRSFEVEVSVIDAADPLHRSREYAERELLPRRGDDVTFTGMLAPVELAALVGASVAALSTPAWAEPFGLDAPEALMCGTPVVSFAVGGVPEIAAKSVGMELVAPGDVDAMCERVERLIRRTADDAAFRSRVRASAVRRFSLDGRIDALEDLFAELATDSRYADGLTA